ncbi:hypothetical protein [Acetivibrio mesophilus]|uniref:Uncharacterized protein n=1 Tax=Acetivibrio mesophilus TaxID=2487273 RepID=A0A4Q0I262_9FIRM|nr:hypothetical protein [Acetivibrio mesophilus]ODM26710.1 hypothetical protein A7W90_11070 [Clostridium sp. Bc-iso-3]RXE58266.1 hypothetical protein EFD62_13265 [Acetivibrio mesophilus]HHV30576.1 hypothetical protein [Clostridium sp.]HOA79441.1 hypothetical protein [Defluviitaleaceae bacterium]
MLNTSIKYMDYFIPQTSITVEEVIAKSEEKHIIPGDNIEEFCKQFKRESRIDEVSSFAQEDDLIKIITEMVERLFCDTGIDPSEVSYLVGGNRVLMDGDISIIHYIHEKFKLKNAVILPIFQPCVSTLFAMGLSRKLLNPIDREYMLILSINKEIDIKDRFIGLTVMGDGISLVLVENRPGLINIKDWCALNNGISSFSKRENLGNAISLLQIRSNIIKNGACFILKSVEQFGISIDDVDIIIPPNTYYDVWDKVYSNLLEIDSSKFYLDNFGYGGHVNDVDFVRNIKDYMDKCLYREKDENMLVYGKDIIASNDMNYQTVFLEIKKN